MDFKINEKDKFDTKDDLNIESPQPLFRELPPSEPYPLDALGDILHSASLVMKEAIQAPDALFGQSLLGASALAVQGLADVVRGEARYPTSLFLMTVAQSGERKSAVDKIVLKAHREIEKNLIIQYEGARHFYEIKHEAWEAKKKSILNRRKNTEKHEFENDLKALGMKPEPPPSQLILMDDPTLEGLQKALLNGRPSVGLFSDEGGLTMGGHSMNADNQLKTISGFSKLWDGDAMPRVRAGDGATKIYGKRMSLHLMMQPRIAGLVTGNDQMKDQGFLSRNLISFPESTAGTRFYKDLDFTENIALLRYYSVIKDALEMPLPIMEGKTNELKPRKLPISQAGMNLWILFYNFVEENLAEGKKFHSIRGFASKASEQVLRIAAVLSLIQDLNAQSVGKDQIESAICLMQFYLSEAVRLFDTALIHPDVILAQKLSDWLKARGESFIPATTVYREGPNSIRHKAVAHKLLAILEEHHHVRKIPEGMVIAGKKRKDVWEVLV
ncbi:YfjI family protein [Bdellovibrio bacteriovorus]|uniref:YfjI family protein n=1 Tax=Bdellovibrio bacteriovorus TaxID=959 RepID=UPI0035A68525